MKIYIVTYWTCGDTLITGRRVEAESKEQAIAILADDPQAPLGQLKTIREAVVAPSDSITGESFS